MGHVSPTVDVGDAETELRPSMEQIATRFRLTADNLQLRAVQTDELGYRHFRYVQVNSGMDVVGGDLIVHVDARGAIYAVNGTARGSFQVSSGKAQISASDSVANLRDHAPQYQDAAIQKIATVRQAYVFSPADKKVHLAYENDVVGLRGADPFHDTTYVDVTSGAVVATHPHILYALDRKVYSANNGSTTPGTIKRTEGQAATSDVDVNAAYDNTGFTYNFYKTLFNRDSYNGTGGSLISTVHYGSNYANAYWDGTQMVYGDGDGVDLGPLARALDVTAHELTHGVTSSTADLVYQGESGALNEAQSDIMGEACEAWAKNNYVPNANTWLVGEDVWTPATPGDALRYMNNPTLDQYSADYYPERLTGSSDNGGVHGNSGIANLAWYLMVQGGTHPRNKTTVVVPAIGITKATAIFYRALTNYYTANTDFAGARTATAQAAQDLYDAATVDAVQKAWDCVGVPGGSTPPPPAPTTTFLTKDVPVSGLAGAASSTASFSFAVPTGATSVTFTTSGGTGDADLYVKLGSMPTTSTSDGKSTGSTTAETVTLTAQAGTYYAIIYGYTAYSGVTIKATWAGSTPPPPPPPGSNVLTNGVPVTGLAGATGNDQRWTFDVPTGATNVKFVTSGGTGDADLYVKLGADPTTSSYGYKSDGSTTTESISISTGTMNGSWHVLVHGYATYSGMSLTATYTIGTPPPPPPSGNVLTKGVPVTGLSGAQNNEKNWTFQVPAGATGLKFQISGGTGDADLYVRFNAAPTTSTYDYRPYLWGNNETINATSRAGTWYVMIRGYQAYSGVTLVATYN